MTTPAQFYTNVVTLLNYLDSGILPMGSHLVVMGVIFTVTINTVCTDSIIYLNEAG